MIDIVRKSREGKALFNSFSASQTARRDNEHPLAPLWDYVFTVEYQTATEKSWTDARQADPVPPFVPPAVVPTQYHPLPYFLATYQEPIANSSRIFDDATRQALNLLDILYRINKQARSFMYLGRASDNSPVIPAHMFISNELTLAFTQQLSDPIMQCFPEAVARWAKRIAESRLRFLLAAEARKTYFVLRFGRIGRALVFLTC